MVECSSILTIIQVPAASKKKATAADKQKKRAKRKEEEDQLTAKRQEMDKAKVRHESCWAKFISLTRV